MFKYISAILNWYLNTSIQFMKQNMFLKYIILIMVSIYSWNKMIILNSFSYIKFLNVWSCLNQFIDIEQTVSYLIILIGKNFIL